nr:integrase, catalytic region, zinc finger, CCHC-type, peptidase aspartic, catalytic [Tanacetum cinerariifolium]
MTGNRSQLMNFVSKFLGTVRIGNDHIARIMRYGDHQLGNVIISRVYYVEGLGHNLFSVGQFCDADLEVAFWKNTCFIRNLEGVNLISRSRDINLYTLSLDDMLKHLRSIFFQKRQRLRAGYGTVDIHEFYENVGISQQTSVARTPQQNGVVVTDIQKKDKIKAKTDKTKHGMEKREKPKSTKSKSTKVKVKDEAETKEMLNRWTKDHPIANVIGDPSRSVSIRKKLKTDVMRCYFEAGNGYSKKGQNQSQNRQNQARNGKA